MGCADRGPEVDAADRFAATAVWQDVILTTEVRRDGAALPSIRTRANATALRGFDVDCVSDELPGEAAREGRWQTQGDAPHRALNSDTEFQELFAQSPDLSTPVGSARGADAQLLVEDVDRYGQQAAELISEQAAAAGAVGFETVVQLLDPILDVTASAIDCLVQVAGRGFEVRDHETRVVLAVAAGMTDEIRLDHHAPTLRPGAGSIGILAVRVRGAWGPLGEAPGAAHQMGGKALKYRIFGHCDMALEAPLLEEGEDVGRSKAAIEPDPRACVRESRRQPRQQTRQDSNGPDRGRGIVRPQHIGKQIRLDLLVEGQESDYSHMASPVVLAIEERELLGAVRRIVGGLEVDRDGPNLAFRPPAASIGYRLGDRKPDPEERTSTESVLKPRPKRSFRIWSLPVGSGQCHPDSGGQSHTDARGPGHQLHASARRAGDDHRFSRSVIRSGRVAHRRSSAVSRRLWSSRAADRTSLRAAGGLDRKTA